MPRAALAPRLPAGQPLHRLLIVTTAGGDVYGQFEISHALVHASSVQLLVDALLKAYEAPPNMNMAAAIRPSDYGTYVLYLERRSEEEDLRYWQSSAPRSHAVCRRIRIWAPSQLTRMTPCKRFR